MNDGVEMRRAEKKRGAGKGIATKRIDTHGNEQVSFEQQRDEPLRLPVLTT